MKIGIIKPGHDLSDIVEMKKDSSTFGGMFEIKGLYDDLVDLGHDVVLTTENAQNFFDEYHNLEMLFIFGSGKEFNCKSLRQFCKPKIQCVTDMNLMYSSNQIGEHYILNQCPDSLSYHPFEKYVVRYTWDKNETCIQHWRDRQFNMIYAGGTRAGGRDALYRKYLKGNTFIDKLYTSASVDHPNVHPKIPMNELMEEYKKTKYGLVIADELYNAFGFVTQRPYEYMINGMICLYDNNYYGCRSSDIIDAKSLKSETFMYDTLIRKTLSRQHTTLNNALSNLEVHKEKLQTKIKRWTE